jgi:cobalt-zinc-cadmium efflux system membrane fusion protein
MKHLVYIISILLFLISCSDKENKAEQPGVAENGHMVVLTDTQMKNAGIETSMLSQKNIAATVKLNGKIDLPPHNMVSVSAPLGGYLLDTRLMPGMRVKKGEVIATLQDVQYVQLQEDYLAAKSRLHFANLEYNRQKTLNESKASSDKATQQAEAEMANLRITVNSLSEKLKLININPKKLSADNITRTIPILSTITGYVSKVNVNIGKYINPGDVMFELVNPNDIHLLLTAYDKDAAKLTIGQKLLAYSNAAPETKYQCKIFLITKDIRNDGSIKVHCRFNKYSKDLLPGMYMNAEVETLSVVATAVPEAAIVTFGGKDYVFVQNGKKQYEMMRITTGTKENGFVALTDAEHIKDRAVVTKGAYTLLMKIKNKEE